jgi:hypothetical protein
MSFTLSDLLKEVYTELGQMQASSATGGGDDYLTDSKMANTSGKDDVWKNGAVFIIEDAGGAGDAPEGEYKLITAYDDTNGKFTVESNFSTQPASGDLYGIVSEYYPLYTMIELANAGLRGLGDIALVDTTTLDTASGQTEYTAALAWKRKTPLRIDYQGETGDEDDNQWIRVFDWEFVPASPGSTGLIVFHSELPAGRDLRIWYLGIHPRLSAFDDEVAEVITPELAISSCVERALRWQNSRLGGGDPFLLQRWNDAKVELGRTIIRFPVWRPGRVVRSKLAGLEG